MRQAFKGSFDRAFKKLAPDLQSVTYQAISDLFDYFDGKIPLPNGLGLKHLGKSYWEIRVGLKTRIFFEIERDLVTFYFIGNHNQLKKFMRNL